MLPTRASTLLRVLVCSAAEDAAAAQALAERLRIERMEPLLPSDTPLGAALARADVAILCLSPAALAGGQLAPPLATALDLSRRAGGTRRLVLALQLAACAPPPTLEGLPMIELFAPKGYERLMRTLWGHIASLRSAPRPAAAGPTAGEPSSASAAVARSVNGAGGARASAPAAPVSAPAPPPAPAALRFAAAHPELERRRAVRLSPGLPGPAWLLANGQALALSSGGAALIDMASGAAQWSIDSPMSGAALSPDGQSLALAAGTDLRIWDLSSGRLRASFIGAAQPLSCLAFHPNGSQLAAGTRGGALILWRVEGAGSAPVQPLASVAAHNEPISCMAFAPDGALIASGAADRTARLWRVIDRGLQRTLSELSAVETLAFSPDGATLAVGHRGRAISLWSLATGRREASLEGHVGPVEALAFSPDGGALVSGSADGELRLWRSADGALSWARPGPGGRVAGLAFAANGASLLSSAEGGLQLWRASDGTPGASAQPFGPPVSALALSKSQLALGGADGGLRCLSLSGEPTAELPPQPGGRIVGLGFTGDGLVAAQASGALRSISLPDGAVSRSEAGVGLRHAVHSGADMALCAGDAGVLLWLVSGAGWRRWASLPTRPQRARRAALAPDGSMIAVALEEGGVQTWHLPRSRQGLPDPYRTFSEPGRSRNLSFSPDSASLIVAAEDGSVQIWRIADGAQIAAFAQQGSPATCVALTPDGRVVAAGFADGGLRLWRIAAPKAGRKQGSAAPISLAGHSAAIEHLAFSPDGAALVSASSDGVVRVWPL
jgi:WD40 repeat protein